MPKIDGGYILIARKMMSSDIMRKPPLYLKLWLWMLNEANYQDGRNGLKRGQFLTTIGEMREAMHWMVGYRKMTPTIKEIRKSYEGLAKGMMIGTTKGRGGLIVTILNYDEYQDHKNYEGHDEGHDERDTKGIKGAHAYKEKRKSNECNEGNNISPDGDMSPETPATPPCPHQKIRQLYNQSLPELPQCISSNATFDKNLRARWREDCDRQSLEWWSWFFQIVKESDFLMGRTRQGFQCSFDWLIKPTNMSKVINGNYQNRVNGGFAELPRRSNREMANLQAGWEFINED